uniref:Large ribosomal subunit protein uL4c n=1 Tax=Yamadaella caenomyce TaxID=259029 RepID=A0A1G4NYW5_9FLOR|nr:Ribosomal protein L4 [Yamadaella caenomyce]SCW23837.1 Ribosomal protein L4 [Yamadaella caenomyce]
MSVKQTIQYTRCDDTNFPKDTYHIQLKTCAENSSSVIHRSLVQHLNQKRQGSASTKTRSNIRGGGKKPWKQKGTGKARAGSIRSPLWRGGGVIFGPKTKEYKTKINTKEKRLAISSLLHNKASNTLIISDKILALDKPKTQDILLQLNNIGITPNQKTLLIVDKKDKNLFLSTRNISYIKLIQANSLHIFALLQADTIVITINALSTLENTYNE